jgi:hypothetical protein
MSDETALLRRAWAASSATWLSAANLVTGAVAVAVSAAELTASAAAAGAAVVALADDPRDALTGGTLSPALSPAI